MSSASLFLGQLHALREAILSSARTGQNVSYVISGRLNKIRAAMTVDAGDIAAAVLTFTSPVKSSDGNPPYPEAGDIALMLCDQLIEILKPLAAPQAEGQSVRAISRIAPESRTVFVVHGHDEANLLRLKTLLKDRFALKPVVLMDEASSGETIIEKFERVAKEAAFCIVLMTPDDRVESTNLTTGQARPNVVFELGWFYGRLGRPRVCILMKRGTSVHSDLAGIVRVEFIERVDEAIPELERELAKVGLFS